jgi:hypothetical protein
MVGNPADRAEMVRNLELWAERPQFPCSITDALAELQMVRGRNGPENGDPA